MAEFEATRQADDVHPPRNVWCQTVDNTSRAYDLTGLNFAGETYNANRSSCVYIRIWADGGNVWFKTGSVNSYTISTSTAVTAGGTPAFNDNVPIGPIATGTYVDVRIQRNVDKYIYLISDSSAKARITASSNRSPSAP